MDKVRIKIKKKETCADLPLPEYMSSGSSGMDLYAAVDEATVIEPGHIKMVSAGIYISLPEGYEAQIRPRSGLAIKHGIGIVNSPGTIDADYRGLINIILINFGNAPYEIKRGTRIAQMVINKVTRAEFEVVDDLERTIRNTGGFGHTGV
ncbi:MAG: dUTP diphosphatase [Candidatus Omnitrophica bacterium]|nr:dUTP diphosphatase [Candidatus Omnitrophota bacterium]MBU4477986.1 dUTP diphosphatase [Candidatus Omnitrophota bacterium]MCG2704190.1 dUTP diphosphatase [Candidatus Omnitrophota bacterium]